MDTLSVHNKNKFGNHALEILFLGNINHFNVFVCKLILFICVVYLTHILYNVIRLNVVIVEIPCAYSKM